MELLKTRVSDGDPPVLHVEGEIDLSTAGQLRTALEAAVAENADVVIDMTGVSFVDAAGLRVVVQVAASRDGGGPLTLRNAPRVKWMLNVVGLSGLSCIAIHDERETCGG